jgi:hypothetical protein
MITIDSALQGINNLVGIIIREPNQVKTEIAHQSHAHFLKRLITNSLMLKSGDKDYDT